MLRSRNVDDQSFEQIMEYAIGRLPWLCPGWTDYNDHDPGITILELISWYKEMQQYHMNAMTDELRLKLLKLLGVFPTPPRPADCLITLPGEEQGRYPVLSRLSNPQNISFELTEEATGGAQVENVYVRGDAGVADMTEILAQPGLSIWPFMGEQGQTQLLIGLTDTQPQLRLWFDVDDERPVARNPFGKDSPDPRTLLWECVGCAEKPEVIDTTHALSHSGFVTLALPQGFTKSDGDCELAPRFYLRVTQVNAGCEEEVRLRAVRAGCYTAIQQETWATCRRIDLGEKQNQLLLNDAVSMQGGVYLFAEQSDGLRFIQSEQTPTADGLMVTFDAAEAPSQGGKILAISQDALRCGQLMFPATGLPDMVIDLTLGGRQVLPDSLRLVCDTLCTDGVIRPALWYYVEDLSSCGPRDRAFCYDPVREQLLFGDGEHGVVPPRSEHGVLVASMALSYCEGGNVPEDCGLVFDDGVTVRNTAASSGADAQSIQQAAAQFLRSLESTQKCASQSDYERAALQTPGLRVAAAKAIAGFDPDEPTGHSRIPVVTVVVLPWSTQPQPLPDARFLSAVQAHLQKLRPICTVVKVIAPRYVPIGALVQVHGNAEGLREQIREAIQSYLTVGEGGRAIGDPVVKDDLMAAIMALDGVTRVQRLELRPLGPDCYADPRGDLKMKRNAVAYLRTLEIQAK